MTGITQNYRSTRLSYAPTLSKPLILFRCGISHNGRSKPLIGTERQQTAACGAQSHMKSPMNFAAARRGPCSRVRPSLQIRMDLPPHPDPAGVRGRFARGGGL